MIDRLEPYKGSANFGGLGGWGDKQPILPPAVLLIGIGIPVGVRFVLRVVGSYVKVNIELLDEMLTLFKGDWSKPQDF